LEEKKNSGFGIAALVLGIIAFLGIILLIPGIICGLLAIIFGIIAITQKNKVGIPITGIVFGALGLLISILVIGLAGYNIYQSNDYSERPLEKLTQINNELFNSDLISGNSWLDTDENSYLVLNNNGTYRYYRDKNDLSDYYYDGTYEVYSGEDAIDYIANDLSRYGFTEKEQRDLIKKGSYDIKNYYCLVLNNEKCIINGKNTYSSTVVTPYYGWVDNYGDKMKLINMSTGTIYNFEMSI